MHLVLTSSLKSRCNRETHSSSSHTLKPVSTSSSTPSNSCHLLTLDSTSGTTRHLQGLGPKCSTPIALAVQLAINHLKVSLETEASPAAHLGCYYKFGISPTYLHYHHLFVTSHDLCHREAQNGRHQGFCTQRHHRTGSVPQRPETPPTTDLRTRTHRRRSSQTVHRLDEPPEATSERLVGRQAILPMPTLLLPHLD